VVPDLPREMAIGIIAAAESVSAKVVSSEALS
jgi:hypothetical protein